MSTESGSGKVVRKVAVYPHPPEVVWVAITDPRALAEWLMPNDFKPVVGHRFEFRVDSGPGFSGITRCEVIEVDPPRRLAFTWVIMPKKPGRTPHTPTTVVFTLEPDGAGTRLIFEHRDVDRITWIHRIQMSFGWGTMVKRWIPKVAARIGTDGVFMPGAIPLAKRCYKVRTVPAEYVR